MSNVNTVSWRRAAGFFLVAGLSLAGAQNLESNLSHLGAAVGKQYVKPIVSGFGSDLNTGWYHRAPAAEKFGFHFEGGVITMASLLGGADKSLNVAGQTRMDTTTARKFANNTSGTTQAQRDSLVKRLTEKDYNVRFAGPTITGSKSDTLKFYFAGGRIPTGHTTGSTPDSVTVPADSSSLGVTGILGNLSALPLFAPQLTFGTVFGTNLTLRWLPETQTTSKIGTVKLFGFGIQHNPAVWFGTKMPVDLSLGYFTQKLEVGSIFKATSWATSLNVSKTLGWRFLNVTPYGGIQYEQSDMDFKYNLVVNGQSYPVAFSTEGENKYRATAGVSLRLLAINLNLDANYAKYPSASFGVMVGI